MFGGEDWGQGEGQPRPHAQTGRVTDSDGGGRVRVGGLELGLGGGPTSILGFEMERERRTFK
jgi:hypothetical protein